MPLYGSTGLVADPDDMPQQRRFRPGHDATARDLELIDAFVTGVQRDMEAAIGQRLPELLRNLHSDSARDEARKVPGRPEGWCDEIDGDLRHWVERDRENGL